MLFYIYLQICVKLYFFEITLFKKFSIMLNYIKFASELCEVTESIFSLKDLHLLFCHLFKNTFFIIFSLAK